MSSRDRTDIDWERIEGDYRAGIKTLRDIAGEHGIVHSAIRKRAGRDGWVRDISAKIKAKADALVSRALVPKLVSKASELDIIAANAASSASIQIAERKDVSSARALVQKLFAELEQHTDNKSELDEIEQILRDGNEGKLANFISKISALPGRIDSVKKLSEALKTLIDLERRVYRIDDTDSSVESFEDFLRKIRSV